MSIVHHICASAWESAGFGGAKLDMENTHMPSTLGKRWWEGAVEKCHM